MPPCNAHAPPLVVDTPGFMVGPEIEARARAPCEPHVRRLGTPARAVRLGCRKDLAAAPEGPERDALFQRHLDGHYAKGQALNMAATLEIDAVIDPAETRRWLSGGLASARVDAAVKPGIDTW